MDHWLTLQGLHTDYFEAFAADHRLAFRGLPAEGLGDCSHEAASSPIRRVGTDGVPGWLPQEGLSLAACGESDPMDRRTRGVLAIALPFSGRRKNTAAIAVGGWFFGDGLLAAPRSTQPARSPRRGGAQWPRRSCGYHFRVLRAAIFGRGISVARTWISQTSEENTNF